MEGLTKENFWNHCNEQYPEAVNEFCAWIDQFKKENHWAKIICNGVKFHDLPFEMQHGILAKYCNEKAFGKGFYEAQAQEFIKNLVACISGEEIVERKCRVCGCTDDDCTECVEKTGEPCHWVEDDLCSACVPEPSALLLPGRDF